LLQEKSVSELNSICEGLGLPVVNDKKKAISLIMTQAEQGAQNNPVRPQAISLRTKRQDGSTIEEAAEQFKKWRKEIFTSNTSGKFSLLNAEGRAYTQDMRYIPLSIEDVRKILHQGWFFAYPGQTDLVELLSTDTEAFEYALIRKPSKGGNSFLMLHCQPKAA